MGTQFSLCCKRVRFHYQPNVWFDGSGGSHSQFRQWEWVNRSDIEVYRQISQEKRSESAVNSTNEWYGRFGRKIYFLYVAVVIFISSSFSNFCSSTIFSSPDSIFPPAFFCFASYSYVKELRSIATNVTLITRFSGTIIPWLECTRIYWAN